MPSNADCCHQNNAICPRVNAAFNDLGTFNIVDLVPLMPFVCHPRAGHRHAGAFFDNFYAFIKISDLIPDLPEKGADGTADLSP